jgi:hypothetical protein
MIARWEHYSPLPAGGSHVNSFLRRETVTMVVKDDPKSRLEAGVPLRFHNLRFHNLRKAGWKPAFRLHNLRVVKKRLVVI